MNSFRAGPQIRGMQVHGVPENERARDPNTQKTYPWGFEYADEPDRLPPGRRPVEERGPFGRSTRRRGTSRSRTGTTPAAASKDDIAQNENLKLIDDIFGTLKKKDAENARAALSTGPTTVPNPNTGALPPTHPSEPTECVLYGFGSDFQFSAIEFYERISMGTILETYDRHPPHSRYSLSLSHFRNETAARSLSSAALQKINTYAGGDHWIKITFDSAEAADRACAASPHTLNGFQVFCERYRNVPPSAGDRAIPANEARPAGPPVESPSSSRTLGAPSPSSTTASSATATTTAMWQQPEMEEVTPRRPHGQTGIQQNVVQQPQQQSQQTTVVGKPQGQLMFGAKRATLLPAEQALLPVQSQWQTLWGLIPGNSWAYSQGPVVRDELPRKMDGTVDWDRASYWWKLCWWIDFFCGTDLLGMKGED